ncbi:MAG: glycosyltransferase family 2 protein [bacterium]
MEFSLIIVNYNLSDEVVSLAKQLLPLSRNGNIEIIFVDNNSSDNFKNKLEVERLVNQNNLYFIFNSENVGFGNACNIGAKQAKGKVLFFVNPDVKIETDIFTKVTELYKKNPNLAITGPLIKHPGKKYDLSAGFNQGFLIELLNIIFVGRLFESMLLSQKVINLNESTLPVTWILGAALFIKRKIFNEIGGFDKDYFLFYEEMDLCYRVRKLGFDVHYYPQISVHHIGSATVKKDYSFFTRQFYKSKMIFYKKNFSKSYFVAMKTIIILQLISQICLWTLLLPVNKNKSVQKLDGLFKLLIG